VRKMTYKGKEYAIKSIPNIGGFTSRAKQRYKSNTPFDYVTNTAPFTEDNSRDEYWRWLHRVVKEYVAMLAIPRPEYVKVRASSRLTLLTDKPR